MKDTKSNAKKRNGGKELNRESIQIYSVEFFRNI